jgi:hypothetical protein
LIEGQERLYSGFKSEGKPGSGKAGKISQLFLVRKFRCIRFVVPKEK